MNKARLDTPAEVDYYNARGILEIELPDLGDHPPAPEMDLATFERHVIDVFIPQAIDRGELTRDSAIAEFKNNEGRQTEAWPDFCGEGV